MSKLKDLIAELCPHGVEFKRLGEICKIKRGIRVVKSQLSEIGKYTVYQNSMTPLGYYDKFNCAANTTFVISAGAAGEIGYSYKDFWAADDCLYIECDKNFNSRFLYYLLLCQQDFIYKNVRRASVPRLSREIIQNLKIPVPPLPVQAEIVRILDTFTELIAELTAELKLRKIQYEYYRDKLLTFDNVEYKKLGEVLKICNGKDYKKFDIGNVPVYGSGGVMTYIDTAIYDKPSVLIPRKGSVDKLYYVDFPFWTVDTIFFTKIDTKLVNPKFVYFLLKKEHLENLNQAGGVPSLTKGVLDEVKIPVPPIEEQERIVNILDKFDKLCNDLREGIPAEIALRKKQYEYYRDKLLTFEEKI